MTDGAPDAAEVVVIGAGQAGLAVGFHLRRAGVLFVILDDAVGPGGAWQHVWGSLHLFSPASVSSLPGWPMPAWSGEGEPSGEHVAAYLRAYEQRYELPVRRPQEVVAVERMSEDEQHRFVVRTAQGGVWRAGWIVNATGSWRRPFWPRPAGVERYRGRQLHTADYRSASEFAGQRVLVVGGGNSGAQIAAELLAAGVETVWTTQRPPRLLPDDVDGRELFRTATRAVQARAEGRADAGVGGLGDIVAVPSVRHARDHLGLRARPLFDHLTETGAHWSQDAAGEERFDAIIWCTGFRPALAHLHGLGLRTEGGHPLTVAPPADPTMPVVAADDPHVLFSGYGDWCGPASATLIGVNRPARAIAGWITR